jgi:hypothetical protein
MTRLLLVALVAALSLPAFAQRSRAPKPDLPRFVERAAPTRSGPSGRTEARRQGLAPGGDLASVSGTTTCSLFRLAVGGPFTEVLWESWEGAWAVDGRIRAVYDGAGRETDCVSEVQEGAVWVPSYRESSAYDGAGRLVEEVTQSDDGAGLENWVRLTYSYDGEGRLSERVQQLWEDGAWASVTRTLYTYDAAGRLTEVVDQDGEDGEWFNFSRDRYTYDGEWLTGSTLESWDWSGEVWEVVGRESYAYDGAGRLVELVVESLDGQGGWSPDYREVLSYDGAGNNTEFLYQSWSGGAWENSQRDLLSYESGLLAVQESQYWEDGGWVAWYRSTATRDAAGRVVQAVDEDWTGAAWENSTRLTFSYSGATAAEDGPSVPTLVRVTPNPARGLSVVAFEVSTAGPVRVAVYDRLGREVVRLAEGPRAAGPHEVPVGHGLAPGVYVVRVETAAWAGATLLTVVR